VMSATGVARALNNIIRKNAWGGGCMGRLMRQLAPLSPAAASGKKNGGLRMLCEEEEEDFCLRPPRKNIEPVLC